MIEINKNSTNSSQNGKNIMKHIIEQIIKKPYLWGLFFLIILGALFSDVFLTPINLLNVARQVTILGIAAFGMTYVIIIKGIDLSVGSLLMLINVIIATYIGDWSILSICILAVAIGALVGALHGLIITQFKIAPFVVTICTMSILRGIGLVYTNGRPIIPPIDNGFNYIAAGKLLNIPFCVYILIISAIFLQILLSRTVFGRHVYAIGGDEESARLLGVRVVRCKIIVYMIMGIVVGLAAIIFTSRIRVGDPTVGFGMEMNVIASVIIGGTNFSGGSGTIIGTLVGAFIMGLINNIFNLLDIPTYYQSIFSGAIILIVVLSRKISEYKSE